MQQATNIPRQMVTRSGMSEKLGPFALAQRNDGLLDPTNGEATMPGDLGTGRHRPLSEACVPSLRQSRPSSPPPPGCETLSCRRRHARDRRGDTVYSGSPQHPRYLLDLDRSRPPSRKRARTARRASRGSQPRYGRRAISGVGRVTRCADRVEHHRRLRTIRSDPGRTGGRQAQRRLRDSWPSGHNYPPDR